MEELVQLMKSCLATSFSFYLKAQYYHWNVEGSDFKQYHDLFGEIYEEVYGSIDVFAEEIRALDSYTPGSFGRFAQLSRISEENTIPDHMTMTKRLLEDTGVIIRLLSETFEKSEEFKQYGLSDFIAGRIDSFKKHAWMLRSSTKTIA